MRREKKLDAFASHPEGGSALSRRQLLRWAGIAGVGGLAGALPACSDPPAQDIVDTTVQPTALRIGGTINGTVTGLLNGDNVSAATIEIVGVGTATTDAAGEFSFRLEQNGDFEIIIRAGGFLSRTSAIRVTGNLSITASLIETDTVLTDDFLNQFARGTGPIVDFAPPTPGVTARWQSRPVIRVYTRLAGDPATKLSDSRVDKIIEVINNAFAGFTARSLGSSPTIVQVDEVPPADLSELPIGVLCFSQTADGSRGADQMRRIDDQYEIASSACFTGTDASGGVLTRVFGQALGATVVDDSMPSVMNAEGRTTFTEEDTLAATVLYNRPPGNAAPDSDPDGFFL